MVKCYFKYTLNKFWRLWLNHDYWKIKQDFDLEEKDNGRYSKVKISNIV